MGPDLGCVTLRARVALLSAVMAAMAAFAGPAVADPCTASGDAVPYCQTTSVQLTLKKDQTEGWALYCPATAYYYWGGWSDSWTSRWHIITENIIEENDNKADFTLTNTRLGDNTVTLTIGCSPVAEWGNACTGPTHSASDPGCPQSNQQTLCTGVGQNLSCFNQWTEICVNGSQVTNYLCRQSGSVTCYTCNG